MITQDTAGFEPYNYDLLITIGADNFGDDALVFEDRDYIPDEWGDVSANTLPNYPNSCTTVDCN